MGFSFRKIGAFRSFPKVNAEDDEAPSSEVYYQIDAGYIPKVVFLDSAG